MPRLKKILFVSESITLAQIVRLYTLASALDPSRFEVHFAATSFPAFLAPKFKVWPLWGLDASTALRRLAAGRRLYSGSVIRRYVAADRDVIAMVKPDLMVGDLRWSLTISAPLCGVPLVNLINAYWTPQARQSGFPMPDHPVVRWLGVTLAEKHFSKALPWVFKHFAAPVNRERQRAGLAPIGTLLQILTFGDFILYADVPELFPGLTIPNHHQFLGPVLWSAPFAPPLDWAISEQHAPIYVTLGSSGGYHVLPIVLKALASLPVQVLLSTAGHTPKDPLPANVKSMPYVDGHEAAKRARLVIHNGGSSTGYQALSLGTPVLGIPNNMDQYLASETIDRYGAGLSLRSGTLTEDGLRHSILRLLQESSFAESARRVGEIFQRYPADSRFRAFVETHLG